MEPGPVPDLPLQTRRFLGRLSPVVDAVLADPARVEREARFPGELAAALHDSGVLAAPLPQHLGGLGLGTEPNAAGACCAWLRALGHAWLPLGRLFEGHLNALRLVMLYGTAEQAERAAEDARRGHLFAIWAAEHPADPVRVEAGRLAGQKTFASGAGIVTRALVTAQDRGERLFLVDVPEGEARVRARPDLHGMRGAGTAAIDLTGLDADPARAIGAAGDYMRQPEISLGAWRPLAVLSGGLAALVEALQSELRARGRAAEPHQSARLGACLAAEETTRLWSMRAAILAETHADEDAANYVKLARHAVDAACAEAIQTVQRAAGLAALARPHPIERMCRDLATYLRQPALDQSVDEAAAHFLNRPLP